MLMSHAPPTNGRCFQLGVATTQLCKSIAIATQTLLARELGSQRSFSTDTGPRNSTQTGTSTVLGSNTGTNSTRDDDSYGANTDSSEPIDGGNGAVGSHGAPSLVRTAARHIVGRGLCAGG